MPFYEYSCVTTEKSCSHCVDKFEVMQSIKDKPLLHCPQCSSDIVKLISLPSAIIMAGKQANQYNDILKAKYWRDQNGNKHLVGAGDGHSNSPTVPKKQTRSDEEVSQIKSKQKSASKKQRTQNSYNRFVKRVKK